MSQPLDISALARQLNETGVDALETFVRTTLVPMVLQDLPVGDPETDPDPMVNLRDKIRVEREGNRIQIVIDAPHAAAQHFALYKHPRGGKAGFLEDNLQVVAPFVQRVIGEAVRQQLAHKT